MEKKMDYCPICKVKTDHYSYNIEKGVGYCFRTRQSYSEVERKMSVSSLDDVIEFKKNKTLDTGSKRSLEDFEPIVSEKFLEEGIGVLTQIDFDIRYDYKSHRVVIPVYNKDKEFIGAIGRLNREVRKGESKYLPVIPYKKSNYLFGIDRLNNTDYLFIVESEKSVMKAKSLGFKLDVLAISGSHISDVQLSTIRRLPHKCIVLALDEGLSNIEIFSQARRLKSTGKIVKYISPTMYDVGSLDCLFDLPVEKVREFTKYIKDYNN